MKKTLILTVSVVTFGLLLSACMKEPPEYIRKTPTEMPTEETEAESTEEEAGAFSAADFIGLWSTEDKYDRKILLRGDGTCFYCELGGNTVSRIKGLEGRWSSKNDGTVVLVFVNSEDRDYLRGGINEDKDRITLANDKTPNNKVAFVSTESVLDAEIELRLNDLRASLTELPDGTYHSSNTDDEVLLSDDSKAAFSRAYIQAGALIITGRIGQYDAEWNETILEGERFKLTLGKNCVITSSGGTEEPEMVNEEYFNSVFRDKTSFLGLGFTIEDGVVTSIDIGS